MSKRKKYSPEFKREAVELVHRSGTSCRQIALEIGVSPNLLTRWVREVDTVVARYFRALAARVMRSWPASSGSWLASPRSGIF
jgi:IS30 family transposase